MVRLNTILESLVTACKQSDVLPNAITYSTVILDTEGAHSDIRPPIIEFRLENKDRVVQRNTERIGKEYDDAGEHIGYVFQKWFTAEVTAEIFTVAGSKYNHRDLNQKLERALAQYDSYTDVPQNFGASPVGRLPDPENPNQCLDSITTFELAQTAPQHSFGLSPSARIRQQAIDLRFEHTFTTSDLGIEYEQIEQVDFSVNDALYSVSQ